MKRISLYAVQEEGALLFSQQDARTVKKFSGRHSVRPLTGRTALAAELPGARISAEGKDAESISIEMGGLRLSRRLTRDTCGRRRADQHARQIVAAPGVMLKTTARYYNCT